MKRIRTGHRVQIVSGTYEGQTGLVVSCCGFGQNRGRLLVHRPNLGVVEVTIQDVEVIGWGSFVRKKEEKKETPPAKTKSGNRLGRRSLPHGN